MAIAFQDMTAAEHDQAAVECDRLVAQMGDQISSLRYRLESSAIEHRRAAAIMRTPVSQESKARADHERACRFGRES